MPIQPLQEQVLRVALGSKLDESINPYLTGSEALQVCENVQYNKHGLVSKAPGYELVEGSLPSGKTTSNLNTCHSMFQHKNTLYLSGKVDGSYLDQYYQLYSWESTREKLHDLGTWAPISQDNKFAIQSTSNDANMRDVDTCICEGYRFITWIEDVTAIVHVPRLTVIEETTGAIILDSKLVTSVSVGSPHLIAVGSKVHAYYLDESNSRIIRFIIDTDAPETIPSSATVVVSSSTLHSDELYDACWTDDDTYGECSCIFYKESGSGYGDVLVYDEDGTQRYSASLTDPMEEVLACETVVDYTDSTTYIAFVWRKAADDYLQTIIRKPDMTAVWASPLSLKDYGDYTINQIAISACQADSRETGATDSAFRIWVGSQYEAATLTWHYQIVETCRVAFEPNGSLVDSVFDKTWINYRLLSRAFNWGDRSHAWLLHSMFDKYYEDNQYGVSQPFALLATVREKNSSDQCLPVTEAIFHVGKALPRESMGLPNVTTSTTGIYEWPCVINNTPSGRYITIAELDYTNTNIRPSFVDNNLLLSGGVQSIYDGEVRDASYYMVPVVMDGSVSTGGSVDDGDHYYKIRYEWTDRNGQWHASDVHIDPADSFPVTAGSGDNTVDLFITPHQAGERNRDEYDTKVCIYRTLAGQTDFFYLVEEVNNDPDSSIIEWSDTTADSVIVSNRAWESDDTVIAPGTAPAGIRSHAHQDRLWVISDEDPTQLWHTHRKQAGYALEFAPELYITMPNKAVGMASLGETLIVFGESQIWAISGQGPDAWGYGQFDQPRLVSNSIGCSSPGSITEISEGILFQDDRGIYLFGQQGIQMISPEVQDLIEDHKVLKAVLMPEKHRVRFVLDNSTLLVWDMEHDRWSLWDDYTDIGDACIYTQDGESKFVFVRDNPLTNLYSETPSAFERLTTATTVDVTTTIRTGWINPGVLTGYQRCWWINLLGNWKSAHSLQVKLYLNYDSSTVVETFTLDCSTSKVPYLGRMKPGSGHQQCSSFMLEISDTDQSGTKESFELTAVEFVVGVEPSAYKRTPTMKQS